jgi:hypothetical protein
MLVECLESMAGLVARSRDPLRAARLFGAAQAVLQSIGLDPPPGRTTRFSYAADVAVLRQRLDPAMVDAAWAEGRAMSLEQAVEAALAAAQPTGSVGPPPLNGPVLETVPTAADSHRVGGPPAEPLLGVATPFGGRRRRARAPEQLVSRER